MAAALGEPADSGHRPTPDGGGAAAAERDAEHPEGGIRAVAAAGGGVVDELREGGRIDSLLKLAAQILQQLFEFRLPVVVVAYKTPHLREAPDLGAVQRPSCMAVQLKEQAPDEGIPVRLCVRRTSGPAPQRRHGAAAARRAAAPAPRDHGGEEPLAEGVLEPALDDTPLPPCAGLPSSLAPEPPPAHPPPPAPPLQLWPPKLVIKPAANSPRPG
eukprot:CAMPEP_0183571516 /NCGR_PEP_ID=MMETSP0371-20130417/126246_1 /TAXON_ID=268820 /ORGANISM="Peridinium aciculiferum, Strain PAER-2" /LENGTH=214 /DNA_ID=CAMNT_0025781291 /DNA_START=39 /DNA_END=680 /DNA_ORIENTATION=+